MPLSLLPLPVYLGCDFIDTSLVKLFKFQESSSKAAKVRKFVILPTEFSISGGELGPTMKIKRHVVESKYKAEIEHMYTTDDRTSLWDA